MSVEKEAIKAALSKEEAIELADRKRRKVAQMIGADKVTDTQIAAAINQLKRVRLLMGAHDEPTV